MTSHKNEKIAIVSPLPSKIFQCLKYWIYYLQKKKRWIQSAPSEFPVFISRVSRSLGLFVGWQFIHILACHLTSVVTEIKPIQVNVISPLFSEICIIRVCIGSFWHCRRQVPILTPKTREGGFFGKGILQMELS